MPDRLPPPPTRLATPDDEAAIVGLLRVSLGEESTDKNQAFWRWKHVDNPFGASPVLVAEDAGRIVGVRAFMQWRWREGTQTHRALRAVDTATHPDYRGRGIFKVLTLELVKRCQEAGYGFIFNTPNAQSRPGYLKMGWQSLGKVPLQLAPVSPLGLVRSFVAGPPAPLALGEPDFRPLADEKAFKWLSELPTPNTWITPPTLEFLQWRYADCPARTYQLAADPSAYLIIYYARQQRVGNELRIVEYLVRPGGEKAARAALDRLRKQFRPTVMTVAPAAALPFYFLPPRRLGLDLTFRPLNLASYIPLPRWHYSLGDLELF